LLGNILHVLRKKATTLKKNLRNLKDKKQVVPQNDRNSNYNQNQGIHHIYILPRFLWETASAINRRAWPSTAKGKDGAAATPTTIPCNLDSMLLMARCNEKAQRFSTN